MSEDDKPNSQLTPLDLLMAFGQARIQANKLGMGISDEQAAEFSTLIMQLAPEMLKTSSQPLYRYKDDFTRLKSQFEEAFPGAEYTVLDFFRQAWPHLAGKGDAAFALVDKHDPELADAVIEYALSRMSGEPEPARRPKLTLLDGGKPNPPKPPIKTEP